MIMTLIMSLIIIIISFGLININYNILIIVCHLVIDTINPEMNTEI